MQAIHLVGDDLLVVNVSTFTSRAKLTFLGSDDKDVNVHFIGGSGDDTNYRENNRRCVDTLQGVGVAPSILWPPKLLQ